MRKTYVVGKFNASITAERSVIEQGRALPNTTFIEFYDRRKAEEYAQTEAEKNITHAYRVFEGYLHLRNKPNIETTRLE